ncbi:MAG: hypothetical protein SF052_05775 [Bacteroidia bacterium]|nr:hypothetical protein [Bacteroidia bacterium]
MEKHTYHRFLDEAGDTTFYGKGKLPIIGNEGVSKCFILGMLKIKQPLDEARKAIIELQEQIIRDPYFKDIPSIHRKQQGSGYFIHAKDDIPEVRKMVFDYIKTLDCSFEAVVGRKIYSLYEKKHNGKEAEFYAELLSHLLKNKINAYEQLVLNISHRSKCTTHTNLQKGLDKAIEISLKKNPEKMNDCRVVFNVQYPTTEPILNIADYFCWSLQRVFEKGESRFYDFLQSKVSLVIDLYDLDNYPDNGNYYTRKKPLTKNNQLK